MREEKAIETLKENYEYAKQQPWVQDHVSFALYRTWRRSDSNRLTRVAKYKPEHITVLDDEEYNQRSEVRDHDITYEHTYNLEDGSV